MSKALLGKLFKSDKNKKIFCHYTDPHAIRVLSNKFSLLLGELNSPQGRPLIVVGIGTDRSTGDSLGPLVGTRLSEIRAKNLHVYGTLDEPVHASNLKEKLQLINEMHDNPLMVAVDASLGRNSSIGNITLSPGSLKPGAGVNKELPEVGEIHFTGVVNVGGFMEYFVLQNTRLNLVFKMAHKIAISIFYGHKLALAQDIKADKTLSV